MGSGHSVDAAALLGRPVFSDSGRRLGRVTAIVHRDGGCDVLVERGWLRHTVVRLELDELVERDGGSYWHQPMRQRASGGPPGGRAA